MEPPFLRATSSIPTVFYKSSASTTLPTAPTPPCTGAPPPARPRPRFEPGRISFPTGRENRSQHAFAKGFVLGNTGGAPSTPAGAGTAGPSTAGCLQRLAALVCAHKYAGVGTLPLFGLRLPDTARAGAACARHRRPVLPPHHAPPRDARHPPQNAISTPTSPLLPEVSRALRTALFTRHLQRVLDTLPTPSAVPDPLGAWQPPRRAVAAAIPFAYEHAGAPAVRARADEVVAIEEASERGHDVTSAGSSPHPPPSLVPRTREWMRSLPSPPSSRAISPVFPTPSSSPTPPASPDFRSNSNSTSTSSHSHRQPVCAPRCAAHAHKTPSPAPRPSVTMTVPTTSPPRGRGAWRVGGCASPTSSIMSSDGMRFEDGEHVE
ncbi:hypothetical protein B0H14DRAFT_3449377 [Mycena olivaceomarginata]|nr:hypothetical protein B0H14DRAFT_3449377 [Mycena olivaceomarginata]